jgi:hypothetical protein
MADPIVILGLSYAGKEAVALVGHFVKEVFGPSAKAVGKGIAAPLKEWADRRSERAARLVIDAASQVEAAGKTPHKVPGRILFPILEKGSLEEEESSELRQVWVNLLASAATGDDNVLPSYPHILSELSSLDVRLLDVVLQRTSDPGSWLYDESDPAFDNWINPWEVVRELESVAPQKQARRATRNIERLGLIEVTYRESKPMLALTSFGYQFSRACAGAVEQRANENPGRVNTSH